jgi:hypothetical protein
MSYSSTEDTVVIIYHITTSDYGCAYTDDQGATWSQGDISIGDVGATKVLEHEHLNPGTTGPAMHMIRGNNTSTRKAATKGASFTTGDSLGTGNTPTAMGFFNDSGQQRVYGTVLNNVVGEVTGWSGVDTATFSNQMNDFAYSSTHGRVVGVGDNQQMGYWDAANKAVTDAWVVIESGFDPTTNIRAVAWNGTDGVFVAVAENGQICRSTNGTN